MKFYLAIATLLLSCVYTFWAFQTTEVLDLSNLVFVTIGLLFSGFVTILSDWSARNRVLLFFLMLLLWVVAFVISYFSYGLLIIPVGGLSAFYVSKMLFYRTHTKNLLRNRMFWGGLASSTLGYILMVNPNFEQTDALMACVIVFWQLTVGTLILIKWSSFQGNGR